MVASLALAALVSANFRRQAGDDSPVQAVRSFAAALNQGDVEAACSLVAGGRFTYPAQSLQHILQTEVKKRNPDFKLLTFSHVGEAQPASSDQATVPVSAAIGAQEPVQETVRLTNSGGHWRLMPSNNPADLKAALPLNGFIMAAAQPVAMLAILTPIVYRSAGKQPEEGQDLRVGTSLLLICAALHDDVWPKEFADLKDGLEPMTKGSGLQSTIASMVARTVDMAQARHWVVNKSLAGRKQIEMTDPFHTVIAYEEGANGLDYRFDGKAIVALANGVTRLVTPEQAAQLRWVP